MKAAKNAWRQTLLHDRPPTRIERTLADATKQLETTEQLGAFVQLPLSYDRSLLWPQADLKDVCQLGHESEQERLDVVGPDFWLSVSKVQLTSPAMTVQPVQIWSVAGHVQGDPIETIVNFGSLQTSSRTMVCNLKVGKRFRLNKANGTLDLELIGRQTRDQRTRNQRTRDRFRVRLGLDSYNPFASQCLMPAATVAVDGPVFIRHDTRGRRPVARGRGSPGRTFWLTIQTDQGLAVSALKQILSPPLDGDSLGAFDEVVFMHDGRHMAGAEARRAIQVKVLKTENAINRYTGRFIFFPTVVEAAVLDQSLLLTFPISHVAYTADGNMDFRACGRVLNAKGGPIAGATCSLECHRFQPTDELVSTTFERANFESDPEKEQPDWMIFL